MKCYCCGQRGKPIGMLYYGKGKQPWVKHRCENSTCRFEMRAEDGTMKRFRPTWATPLKEIR